MSRRLFWQTICRRLLSLKKQDDDDDDDTTESLLEKVVAAPVVTTQNRQQQQLCCNNNAKEQVLVEYVDRISAHDAANLGPIFTPGADIYFTDCPMILSGYQEELCHLFRSFPDYHITTVDTNGMMIQEQPNGTTVVIARLTVHGTHTGAPYGYGPYPEIPISNIRVWNNQERVTVTIRDGKIAKLVVEPIVKGGISGPPGFYQHIGGLIF